MRVNEVSLPLLPMHSVDQGSNITKIYAFSEESKENEKEPKKKKNMNYTKANRRSE